MQRITEAVDCALCHMPASRWALRQSSDGYMYDCPACGGRYSIGTSALARAKNGEVPPGLLADVRHAIARGDIPRVGRTASEWHPLDVVGRQDADADL
ncbi:Transcription factor zinc-finger domain-containing protein (plasmid) [Cupriavidus necator H16]|uniref:Uncharacterized protein n=1 Tax=Cupriavidus necator (strain ATCC 17699 / DSM 428 / KCTC 22496 / NCIMB 10442 / H16 / Stanier 337) TaxID=381666 RepID=Q7WWW3_CUPNH|nr:hypothetical protein [Cupriavidus necator]AAP86128.1 hypothetical protein PHG379 [Cupriavidus necator H16]QCC05597.1 hypothetical protein E6A55_34150 [Cupriavidus necator H16]QQB81417.1 hypothetical protein I6H87_34080 [Cupriavidus necator]